jgi:hypothetical protein
MKTIYFLIALIINNLVLAQVQLGIKANQLLNGNRFINDFKGFGAIASLNLKGNNFQPFIYCESNYGKIAAIDADLSIRSNQTVFGFGSFLKCSNLNQKDLLFKVVSSVGTSKTESKFTGIYANWVDRKTYYHYVFDLGCDLQVLQLFQSNLNLDIFCIPEIWFHTKSTETTNSLFDYKKYYPLNKNTLWLKLGIGLTYSLDLNHPK